MRAARLRHTSKLVLAGVALVLLPATAVGAQESTGGADVLLSGGGVLAQTDSQFAAVVPYAGGTALPVKIGIAGSRLDGAVATSSSGAADLGLLGSLATLALINAPTLQKVGVPTQSLSSFQLPAPVTADSRTKPEATGTPVFPRIAAGPLELRGGYEYASAQDKGPAHSRTEMGAMSVDLGVVRITASGGVAETSASATEIRSSASIGELRFDASGAAPVLRGINWRFVQRVGQAPVTSFTIGSADIGPTRYAFDSPAAVRSGFAQINRTLKATGLSLTPPSPTGSGLTPIVIKLKDSDLASKLVGPLYSRVLADAINRVESTLVSGLPESGLALTVANVGLAALTGRGGIAIELGGVSGTLGHRPVETFDYGSALGASTDQTPLAFESAPNLPRGATSDAEPVALPSLGSTRNPAASRDVGASTPVLRVAAEKAPALVILLGSLAALALVGALDRRRLAAYLYEKERT
jgi:hypothetical protein